MNDEHASTAVGSLSPDIEQDLTMPVATLQRYPQYKMPFAGSQVERDERFAETVEAFLLNYCYNTARAYRADLEDIYLWARERGLDLFELTEAQVRQYQGLLRRRRYSNSTIRRRMTAWRGVTLGRTHSFGSMRST